MSSDCHSSVPPVPPKTISSRTLLLAPPSVAAHPEVLERTFASHDRSVTDIQMLDRLSLSLVNLPKSTYDIILLLADAETSSSSVFQSISKDVLYKLYQALRPGGRVRGQNDALQLSDGCRTEAILSGFVFTEGVLLKPLEQATQSVPFRARKQSGHKATTDVAGTGAVSLNLNGKRMNGPPISTRPAGVGFVEASHDLGSLNDNDTISDDELIDEDTLLDEEDLKGPTVQRLSNRSESF